MTEIEYQEPTPELYNAFVAGLALEEIQLVRVSGERRIAGEPSELGFGFGGGFAVEADRLQIRYDVTAQLLGDEAAVLSEVQASVVVVLAMAEAGSPECFNRFAGSSGALMAHPYLREVVQSTAARLGHPGVVVPMATTIPVLAATVATMSAE